MDMHGHPWISMDFHGCALIPMDEKARNWGLKHAGFLNNLRPSYRAKNGSYRDQQTQKLQKNKKKRGFHTNWFLTIWIGIWEVWGCGAWHGPYDAIPSNFGRIWSYMAWGKSIFMFFGNIGNSLHHQIPPNWSSGLQVGPRIFLKARVPSQEL